jgi:two-component system, LytTR family, response regulator
MGSPNRSMRIRTVVVDDEALARRSVTLLLARDPEIELVGEYDSGTTALSAISNLKPDLVLLDVQMPECGGFDVVERLGTNLPPAIVFVTAYDQYALRAFEAGALDYLLKPFDDDRFDLAVNRAKHRVRERRQSPWTGGRFIIRGTGQVSFVRISEIDWIEGADYYACIHAGSETHMLRRSLSDLEKELRPAFCRIHRSTIVNLDRVKSLKLNPEGEYDVLLRPGTVLRVSRRYRRHLESRLGIHSAT